MIINSFISFASGSVVSAKPLAVNDDNLTFITLLTVGQFSLLVPSGVTSMTISTLNLPPNEVGDMILWADPDTYFFDPATASSNAQEYRDDNSSSADETITIANPAAGVWKIGAYPTDGDANDAAIHVSMALTPIELENGVAVDFQTPEGLATQFTMYMPFGATSVSFEVSGFDRHYSAWADTTNVYTNSDEAFGSAEVGYGPEDEAASMTLTSPIAASTWKIAVQPLVTGQAGTNGLTGHITAVLTMPDITELTSGVAAAFAGDTDQVLQFAIVVPSGATSLTINADGVDGDIVLWYSSDRAFGNNDDAFSNAPHYADNDSPTVYAETLSETSPAAGHYIIGVYLWEPVTSGTITATVTTE